MTERCEELAEQTRLVPRTGAATPLSHGALRHDSSPQGEPWCGVFPQAFCKSPLQHGRPMAAPTILCTKKSDLLLQVGFLCWRYLSSRAVARKVLSAKVSLTSVFGMGTGGPSPQSTPTASKHLLRSGCTLKTEHELLLQLFQALSLLSPIVGQALGLLVSVSYTPYGASTPDLSTT